MANSTDILAFLYLAAGGGRAMLWAFQTPSKTQLLDIPEGLLQILLEIERIVVVASHNVRTGQNVPPFSD
jgi:hypothetical protein